MVEHWTVTPLRQVRFPDAARIFLPESTFSADSLTCVRAHPCSIACINICGHVKDALVHVRVRWTMETLKDPACTAGWTARLCRSWLSPRECNPNFLWKKSKWDNTVVIKKIIKKLILRPRYQSRRGKTGFSILSAAHFIYSLSIFTRVQLVH